MRETPNWPDPRAHILRHRPDTAMVYFCPAVLQATARRFQQGFDGLVTYAVKANAGEEVLTNLVAAGIRAFDVASPREMYAVRAVCPDAVLHYHNPVRSPEEVAVAVALGVTSYSVDCARELDKLSGVPAGAEMSVRLALPVAGAAYDFGEKFGVGPDQAIELLSAVVARGFTPSVTFHPGTQCADPTAWASYIKVVGEVARTAGVTLARLNVGGGFAAHRIGAAPDLEAIFDHIRAEVDAVFGEDAPALVCEPGRAMVADAFTLATRVKALRSDGSVFLNDGIYGGLFEMRDIECTDRVTVLTEEGVWRGGAMQARIVFGPTCDSIDRLPDALLLPQEMAEGDYVLFAGMGAYSRSLTTQFNGYGLGAPVTVAAL
ncbi:type III PLP-dependent enzyme [uncultured Roseovarius sp.]|uniref:type III PLP-dependent enzyme n=1 Tax=uncultured Roseovarius sp. TaxID=293344 RepID=UPI00262F5345|nr:type III PLP-dependent enzyme [uncultured Roseovarius sp.]